MKLGNVSQSIIPVPKFFLNKRSIDLFESNYNTKQSISTERDINSTSKKKKIFQKNKRNKSYFRTKDILSLNCDLNINLNPRSFSRQSITDNKERYLPLYHRNRYQSNAELKETYFPDITDMNAPKTNYSIPIKQSNLQKFKDYKKKLNIEKIVNPDLRSDIMNNATNLIKRINMNYNIKKWNDFDSRTTFNRFHQTAYSPITDVIQNNLSDKDAFSMTLREKALTLKTISNKAKDSIIKSIDKKDFIRSMKNCEEKINNDKVDLLLEKNRKNFLRLKYNNCDGPKYNEKDTKFIFENKTVTDKINRTKLYNGFPSSIKEEFHEVDYFFNNKEPLKMTDYNSKGFISKEKYGYKNANSNGDELTSCQDPMWIRPLHDDAL